MSYKVPSKGPPLNKLDIPSFDSNHILWSQIESDLDKLDDILNDKSTNSPKEDNFNRLHSSLNIRNTPPE